MQSFVKQDQSKGKVIQPAVDAPCPLGKYYE